MNKILNRRQQYFAALASILLITEYCIAQYLDSGFIRTIVGDVFIAMLIYSIVRAFTTFEIRRLGLMVWIFTILVELSQWIQIVELLGSPRNQYTTMVFGNTFDWKDILAYTIGIIISICIDIWLKNKFSKPQKTK